MAKRNKFDQDESYEEKVSVSHLKRSLVYVKKYKWQMALSLALSLLASYISLMGPRIIQRAIDEAMPAGDTHLLSTLAVMLTGTIIISLLFNTIRNLIMVRVGQNIIYDIRSDLFAHLQALSFTYYDTRPEGKILVRVVQYVNNVSDMLSNGILNMIIEVFNIIFITIFMFRTDVRMALMIAAGLPVLVLVICLIKPAQRKAWRVINNKISNMSAYMCENIEGVKITQMFVRQEHNAETFRGLNQVLNKAWMKGIYISNLVGLSVDNIAQWATALMYMAGIWWFVKPGQAVQVGVIIAMGTYASRFWQPITSIAAIYNNLINTLSYLERIFQTMDEPVEICDAENAYTLPPITGNVEFRDVTFSYEPGIPILKHVSFQVQAGQSVALVGPTGAGKSTIVNLISRFYNVDSGQVLLDGHSVNDVTVHSLRSQMGIMLQDSFIFSGTIADNIRYGKLDATDAEIEEAARRVQADEFIRQMEHGYYTEVNERGGRLSQGQKQLISFARTLVSDPAILVLDEATSSIDAKTEAMLQQGINELLKGRTSFIIAHRLSTIRNCDRIFFIDDGRIVEAGTHEELMGKQGRYYELCNSQKDFVE